MTGKPLHHLALRVADPSVSARFYSALGLPEVRRHGDEDGRVRSVWLSLAPGVLMLERNLRPPGAQSGSGHVLVLPVANIAEAEALFASVGAEVVARTEFTIYGHDPDHHRVGLSWLNWPG